MTQADFLKALEAKYARNVEISRAKNTDYAGSDNAFKNFEVMEYLTNGRVSVEEGMLTRITDKLQRIANLLYSENQVKDESIQDTLADLANYAMILAVYYDSKKEHKKKTVSTKKKKNGKTIDLYTAFEALAGWDYRSTKK